MPYEYEEDFDELTPPIDVDVLCDLEEFFEVLAKVLTEKLADLEVLKELLVDLEVEVLLDTLADSLEDFDVLLETDVLKLTDNDLELLS